MKISKLSFVFFLTFFTALTLSSLSIAVNNNEGRISHEADAGIAFNFVDVEIPTVIKFISEITGKNFLFDDRIKGKITIIAPTKLSTDESFNLFTSVLSLKGFTIIPSGPSTYKIIPSSLAKQSGVISPDAVLPVNEGYITKLITGEHIEAAEALQFLRPVISRDGHISAFGPRNMLLVVDSAINIDKIMTILELIDKPSIMEEEAKINVYFLEYADATDLAKILQTILKDLQTSYKAAARTKKNGTEKSAPILSVTPDIATNALVIVAPPSDYENIMTVVKTLDKKRKQVFVEAMIVEAKVSNLQELGTRWRAIATHDDDPVAIGGFGNISSGTVLDIITGLSGLSAGGMGNYLDIPVTGVSADGTITNQTLTAPGFAAIFSLEEFKDSVNVLSTPQILTSDNEEAEIFVGENSPFISQRERDVVTTNTVLNSIERTDVGIKLNIKPQITIGDYVKLEIFQEISAVEDASDEILATVGPTTTKRATKTSVVVKDGRTVVIGGLMQEREVENVTKVPLLGDIPILEWLFKFKRTSKDKTNLLVFLSPHIVKETPQLAKITREKREEFVSTEHYYSPGELLVKFKDGVSEQRAEELISLMKASLIKHFKNINVYHIKLKSGQDIEDAIKEFSSLPEVSYSEPNYKVKIPSQPEGTRQERPAPGIDMNKNDGPPEKESSIPSQHAEVSKPAADVKADRVLLSVTTVNSPHEDDPEERENKKPITPEIKEETKTEQTIQAVHDRPQSKKHFIQVGSWINIKYAIETMEKLRTRYPDIYLTEDGKFNKVRIPGSMSSREDALILKELKEDFKLKPILVNKTI
jgi:type II secretory pathway component GspD/PulD (secretin)